MFRSLVAVASKTASTVWPLVQRINQGGARPSFQPDWAPAPLQKGHQQNMPQLGWPRQTDSLCPRCVKEARDRILSGEEDWQVLLTETPGELKATILERDGSVYMEKTCPVHGTFTDLMAIDAKFLARIESLHPGGDFETAPTPLRNHGKSTIKYGRGAVYTVDLTNRCNMMCDACFMDANQVGYVHELTMDDVRQIIDNALSVKPRRQMSINFSGGEPTISPIFLDAVRYAKQAGFFAIQASTNGIRFAQEPEFAKAAKEAGLRVAYLQFDGIGNEAHAHRRIGNLFDVKQRAIENLHAADIDVVLVPTLINGITSHQVGPVVDFAIQNADKVTVIAFQPVSFTGRDEDIDDETRQARRYTLSHLARDMSAQTGLTDPLKDWFPLSALGPFADLVDLVMGPQAEFGSLKCGCHPNCGTGTILFVNKRTKQAVPMSKIVDLEQLMKDVRVVADAAHGNRLTLAQVGLALLKNFNAKESPISFPTLLRQFLSQTGANDLGGPKDSHQYEWRILFVAGMWFQDLFNYDFRRTERCIVPYGTQMGEISFCAYNTGVGFRQIVESIHQVAKVDDWYKQKGRHAVYANRKPLPLPPQPSMPWEKQPAADSGLVQIGVRNRVAAPSKQLGAQLGNAAAPQV